MQVSSPEGPSPLMYGKVCRREAFLPEGPPTWGVKAGARSGLVCFSRHGLCALVFSGCFQVSYKESTDGSVWKRTAEWHHGCLIRG